MDRPDLATVRTRLEMVGRLIQSCRDLLAGWKPKHLGEEIARRDIEAAARVVLMGVADYCGELGASRLLLRASDCPHCAWPIAPRSVERCPRCNGPREVRDEARVGDYRDAS